jgi:hypothetical protein
VCGHGAGSAAGRTPAGHHRRKLRPRRRSIDPAAQSGSNTRANKAEIPAISYLGTSSAANIGADKDSDRRQREAIQAFARRVGYELVGEYGLGIMRQCPRRKHWIGSASGWTKARDPHGASRAMREYLATLDDAAFGAASEVMPKFVSPSDPAAQWTGAMRGPAFFAYADNYLIDVKFGIVMDVKASRAIRQAEVGAARGDAGAEAHNRSRAKLGAERAPADHHAPGHRSTSRR